MGWGGELTLIESFTLMEKNKSHVDTRKRSTLAHKEISDVK